MAKRKRRGKQTIEILGVPEVQRALKKLGDNVDLEAIAMAAGVPIQNRASDLAPDRTGNLKEHIEIQTLENKSDSIEVGVGPDDDVAWYARFIEFGTPPHSIKPDNAQALQIDNDFRASAHHPGTTAQPFLSAAFEQSQRDAIKAAEEEAKRQLGLK